MTHKKAKIDSDELGDWYIVGMWITGPLTFFGIWIYAFASWGFLVGLAIGWLPAIIGAFIAAFLWPLLALALAGFVVVMILANA